MTSQINAEKILLSNLYLINKFREVVLSQYQNQFLLYTITKIQHAKLNFENKNKQRIFEALTGYQLKQRFSFYIHSTSSIILLLQVSNLGNYS